MQANLIIPENVIADLAKELTVKNPEQLQLAIRFIQLSADPDPFPVNFDEASQLLGCSRKDNAKRTFLGCRFIEGEDYVTRHVPKSVSRSAPTPREIALLNLEDCKQTGFVDPVPESAPQSAVTNKGGHYREEMFLTQTCFDEFAMTVNKGARRFFARCKDAWLRLQTKIQSGEISVTRNNTRTCASAGELEDWQGAREEAVEDHKCLMRLLDDGLAAGQRTPAFFGSFNSELNRTVCGYGKTEFGRLVGENKRNSSWVQRDYFSEQQLGLLKAINALISQAIRDENAVTAIHKERIRERICQDHLPIARKLYHGTHLNTKRSRKNEPETSSRRSITAGSGAQPITSGTTRTRSRTRSRTSRISRSRAGIENNSMTAQSANGIGTVNTINNYFATVHQTIAPTPAPAPESAPAQEAPVEAEPLPAN
jgi:hypothetical protein